MELEQIWDCSSKPAVNDSFVRTPVKAKLGQFADVYSPEHINCTPNPKVILNAATQNENNFVTPQRISNNQYECRSARPQFRRLLHRSFEANQSFPGLKSKLNLKMELESLSRTKLTDLVRVDGPNGLRFNHSLATVDLPGSPAQSQSDRLQQAINSNKGVFTIEPKSSKILIVNNKASSLLGYSSGELVGLKLSDLVWSRGPKSFSLQEPGDRDSEDYSAVPLTGKVVELMTKDGGTVQVSLWIRQLEDEGPSFVVAEPVSCRNVVLAVDAETGLIISCEGEEAPLLFGADSAESLLGLPVSSLIPSIQLPPVDSTVPSHVAKQKATGRTLDGASFPLCLWITVPDAAERSALKNKERAIFEVHIRVTYNVSGLLVIDETGTITACNHHFAMLTFGRSQGDVIGRHIEDLIPNFCRENDMVKLQDRNRNMTLSLVNPDENGSASDTDDSCDAFNGSQKSACTSLNVQQSLLSTTTTREKSSSAQCLDKSCSMVTHTPTPTQDMVSSLSTTEQRNDLSIPDITSGMSGVSVDEEALYGFSSISKSRSENQLRNGKRIDAEKSDSIYYTSEHEEVTPTGNTPRIKNNDPSLRLSLDSSKYRSLKANAQSQKDDKTSLSLDLCDSNETSADFLTPINEMPPPGCEIDELPKQNGSESLNLDTETEPVAKKKYAHGLETPLKRVLHSQVMTSTPLQSHTVDCAVDGTYRGVIVHKDLTQLNIVYTVKSMQLANGDRVLCVWLRVQLEEPRHNTLASSQTSTADNSLVFGNKSVSSRPLSVSLPSQCGEEQTAGEYGKHYVTLKQIGKGAYGCVKMAYRRSDRLLTVTKFILKERVGAQMWVDGENGKRLPLELSLLMKLKHPNIVSVIDVFENDKYFQMVMEKHGCGMDLFEFIERRPTLDEPLLSYIFRQIGQAVEYLHSLNILHRDIKDENVIIDNKFHVKLIDFGSATFRSKDTMFSTFYGTLEYCSPEVLTGNEYAGPELEMWSMGVTLFVLTFFVNPFSDVEDTIKGTLAFPQPVSEDLEHLLRWMLNKDPSQRCTVPEMIAHPWLRQPVAVSNYVFHQIVECDPHEANPEMYYSGNGSPRSGSTVSLGDHLQRERSYPSEVAVRSEGKNISREEPKRNSLLHVLSTADRDAQSDNYSLRSSADILDISSKPVSEAALTDISSDATGHAACDIDCDCDNYEYDSWDECEQDSF